MPDEQEFHIQLAELLEQRGWSQRELARHTERESGWGSSVTISLLASGELPPGIPAMEAIARAFRIDPARFPEYRMALLRNRLDPKRSPFSSALEALHLIESKIDW